MDELTAVGCRLSWNAVAISLFVHTPEVKSKSYLKWYNRSTTNFFCRYSCRGPNCRGTGVYCICANGKGKVTAKGSLQGLVQSRSCTAND